MKIINEWLQNGKWSPKELFSGSTIFKFEHFIIITHIRQTLDLCWNFFVFNSCHLILIAWNFYHFVIDNVIVYCFYYFVIYTMLLFVRVSFVFNSCYIVRIEWIFYYFIIFKYMSTSVCVNDKVQFPFLLVMRLIIIIDTSCVLFIM